MTPAAPSVGPSERAIADAIRYRSMLGLRNDEAYVRRLAADPEAVALGTRSIGFPATQDEIDLVEARARASDEVIRIVREYAEDHPDTWADLYIDTPTGTVFAQFTAELDQHRAALAKLLIRMPAWSCGSSAGRIVN